MQETIPNKKYTALQVKQMEGVITFSTTKGRKLNKVGSLKKAANPMRRNRIFGLKKAALAACELQFWSYRE